MRLGGPAGAAAFVLATSGLVAAQDAPTGEQPLAATAQSPADPRKGLCATDGHAYPAVDTEMNDPDMMYTGIGLTVGGVVVGAAGGIMFATSLDPADPKLLIGFLMMPVGGLFVLGGVSFWIAGAWPVPIEPESALVPTISVGPTGGSLNWSF